MKIPWIIKLLGLLILLLLILLLIYQLRPNKTSFNACYTPNSINVSKIDMIADGQLSSITLEGNILSSALYYSDFIYTVENGVMKIGVKYTSIKPSNIASSNFLIKIETNEKINEIYLADDKTTKKIY